MEKIKLCLFCSHCKFNDGYALSDATWEAGYIECTKRLNDCSCDIDRTEFANWSRKAETCESYKLDDL